jgi:hypothetical protein
MLEFLLITKPPVRSLIMHSRLDAPIAENLIVEYYRRHSVSAISLPAHSRSFHPRLHHRFTTGFSHATTDVITCADGELPVASIGRVWCWCDAEANSSIELASLN